MSESITHLPSLGPEEPYIVPLKLVDSNEIETEEEYVEKFPTIDLGLDKRVQNIFGSKLPTNRDARLRTVVNALTEVAPDSFPNGLLEYPAPDARKVMDKYLSGKVTVKPGVSVPRNELVWFGLVLREPLVDSLRRFNHPIYQALRSVNDMNHLRQAENMVRIEKLNVLSDKEFDELTDDILKVTMTKEIIGYCALSILHAKADDQPELES